MNVKFAKKTNIGLFLKNKLLMPGYYKMLIHIFYRMQNVKNTIFHNLIKFSVDWLSPSGDSELYWKINL